MEGEARYGWSGSLEIEMNRGALWVIGGMARS